MKRILVALCMSLSTFTAIPCPYRPFDEEARPLVIGGETYAKCCRNVVAFGGLFPGDPDVMHQKDEKIQVRRFYQLIEIYAEAIQRLDQMAIPADIDANLETALVAACEEEENE